MPAADANRSASGGDLPAGGGVFIAANLAPYAYGRWNPVRFNDPTGAASNEAIKGTDYGFRIDQGPGGNSPAHLHLLDSEGNTIISLNPETLEAVAHDGEFKAVQQLTKREKEALVKMIAQKPNKFGSVSRETADALLTTKVGKKVLGRLVEKGLRVLPVVIAAYILIEGGFSEEAANEAALNVTGLDVLRDVAMTAGEFGMKNLPKTVLYDKLFGSTFRGADAAYQTQFQ
jgi:hypothetical protein